MAVVIGWDVERGARWIPPFDDALAQWADRGTATTRCQIQDAAPGVGTTVHLMLQGGTRGLVGRGTVGSAPFASGAARQPGRLALHVLVEWDRLLPVEDRIRPEELAARVPGIDWAGLYRPVLHLTGEQSARLDRVWISPHPSALAGRTRWPGRAATRVAR